MTPLFDAPGSKEHKERQIFYAGLAALIALVVILLFANLGNRVLWEDESQNALMARQVLKHGIPLFRGELNIPTDTPLLSDFNKEMVFIWNTWLPYYLTAISFKLFGESEWSARLPFALFGLLTVLLYVKMTVGLFGRDYRRILTAVLLLVFSVPFILHMRQSRYYALVTFGTLWMTWGYLKALGGNKSGLAHFAWAGLLCFHSFPAVAVLNISALWVHWMLKGRGAIPLRYMSLATVAIAIFSAPAVWYMRLWEHKTNEVITLSGIVGSLRIYLYWINGFFAPFALPVTASFLSRDSKRFLLLGSYAAFLTGVSLDNRYTQLIGLAFVAVIFCVFIFRSCSHGFRIQGKSAPEDDGEGLESFHGVLGVMLIFYLAGMSVLSPYAFFRYVLPLLPLVLIATTSCIKILLSRNVFLGGVFLMVMLCSNFFSAAPLKTFEYIFTKEGQPREEYTVFPGDIWRWTALRSDIVGFLHEITHDIRDPEQVIVDFIKRNGKSGQMVKTSYDDITSMFYLPNIRTISRHDGGGGIPDYIIVRGPYPLLQNRDFLKTVQQEKYHEITLPTPDIVWGNNPDPLYHRFRMPQGLPPLKIYAREPDKMMP